MSNIRIYRGINLYEAIQYSEKTHDEIMEWSNARIEGGVVHISCNGKKNCKHTFICRNGHWVVKFSSGEFVVYSNKMFNQNFVLL